MGRMTVSMRALAAPTPRKQRVATMILFVVLGTGLLFLGWLGGPVFMGLLGTLYAAMAGYAIASHPVAYTLTDEATLVVERRALPARRFAEVRAVERFTDLGALHRRAHGSGLLLPGAGSWEAQKTLTGGGASPGYRLARHFTDQRRLVRIEVSGGTVLISPIDPSSFAQEARKVIAQTE